MRLTGAMSKMGMYGLLRIVLPIFPDQMRAVINFLLALAVLTIVYSALAALGLVLCIIPFAGHATARALLARTRY